MSTTMPSQPLNELTENYSDVIGLPVSATEYATQGAGRKLQSELPHLRLVRPLRPERASRGFFAVLIAAMLGFGLVLMLVINTSVAQTAFTVTELKIQQRDLSRTEAALTKALAEAASPPLLEAKARSLGMIPSDRAVFLTVPNGKVRGKAKPAPGNRARTANLAGSLTATLADPIPLDTVEVEAAAQSAADAGERRQIGDGAVLLVPGSPAEVNEATEQARRNEQRQQDRAAATSDGARLVQPGQAGQGTGDGAQVDGGDRE
jgi:cell division protein FtsB